MSDPVPSTSKAKTEEDASDLSSSLDVTSSEFDPILALYSPDFPVHDRAPVFDNVDKFISVCKGKKPGVKSKPEAATLDQPMERRFTEEQQMVERPNSRKALPNVLKFMEAQSQLGGPFSLLSRCMEEDKRVKVITRGANKVRGFCVGFLVAFDKHWNLVLVDVDETYERKRHGKPILDQENEKKEEEEYVGTSKVRVVKCRRKTQQCQRHVPQVMLRGEHVVLISAAP